MLTAEDPSSSYEDPWDMPSQRGQNFIYLSKYKYYAYRKFLLYIYIYIYYIRNQLDVKFSNSNKVISERKNINVDKM